MTEKEISSKITEIYNTESGKKFITHLLRNFFPMNKSTFSLEKPEGKRMVCCITGAKLCTRLDALGANMAVTMEEFTEYMKAMFDPDRKEPLEHPIKKKLEGKVLAIECEGSDKMLCKDAFDGLYNFYADQILRGNKHMNWLGKDMMRKEYVSQWQKQGIVESKEEEYAIRKAVNKPAKISLGDFAVLQQVKDKLAAQENTGTEKVEETNG